MPVPPRLADVPTIIVSMKPPPIHRAQVFSSPWAGVYGTHLESERHFGRHWHAVYGLGLLEDGAQRSASGRGTVAAYAGDLISTNPGEVHDGKALGETIHPWQWLGFICGCQAASFTTKFIAKLASMPCKTCANSYYLHSYKNAAGRAIQGCDTEFFENPDHPGRNV